MKVDDNQYITQRHLTNLHFRDKTVKMGYNFPQIEEMRLTFASCRSFMT